MTYTRLPEINGVQLSRRAMAALGDLQRGPMLTGRWEFSGDNRTMRLLLQAEVARRADHPTVIDRRMGWPATALFITGLGRETLAKWRNRKS